MKRFFLPLLLASSISLINLQALTLEEAVGEVLNTNPIVQERLKNYNKTVQDLKIAKSGFAPSIDVESRIGYEKYYNKHTTAGFEKGGFNTYTNTLSVTQNLFKGFETVSRVNYEKARVMAAAYNYVEKTNDIAYNVVREYLNILRYKELHELEQENIVLTKGIFSKMQELNDSGFGTLSDVKKVDSSLQLAEFNFLTQKNNLMDAEFNLGKLLGRKVDNGTTSVPIFEHTIPVNLDTATYHAMTLNPSILVTNYNIKSAQSQLRESKSSLYPTLDFEFDYSLSKDSSAEFGHSRDYSAMLVVQYNLYRGGADVRRIQKNISNIRQEYAIQRDIKRQIIEGLQLSWSAYTMVEKQLNFLNYYQVNSKETLDLYKEEFDDGQRTLLDLLTAQNEYINSKNKSIGAKYDLLFAKYRILDAMGEMVKVMFDDSTNYYAPVNANYKAVGMDKHLFVEDIDNDTIIDEKDICDNSLKGSNIDKYGCIKEKTVEVVLPAKTVAPVITPKEIKPIVYDSFKDEFLNASGGYTLGVATFSSEKSAQRFLDKYNTEDNMLAITYVTKVTKKTNIKVVYGIYSTITQGKKALLELPKGLRVHKPYIENIYNMQDLYNKNN